MMKQKRASSRIEDTKCKIIWWGTESNHIVDVLQLTITLITVRSRGNYYSIIVDEQSVYSTTCIGDFRAPSTPWHWNVLKALLGKLKSIKCVMWSQPRRNCLMEISIKEVSYLRVFRKSTARRRGIYVPSHWMEILRGKIDK